MFVRVHKDRGVERLYICRSVRNGSAVKSENVVSLGRIDKLCEEMNFTRDQVLAWADQKLNELEKKPSLPVSIPFFPDKLINKDEQRSFMAGYLFLQDIYYAMKMKNVFRNIKVRHQYQFDLDAIFSDLVFARILEPCSKYASFNTAMKFLEQPSYERHDVYRALSILSGEMDYIQAEVYKNSNYVYPRNNRVLFYDCTNYYFEEELEDQLRKYGKSKEHRPNPIVQMGLFMDGNGIPLAFSIFDGSSNEQPSLKPLEENIIKNFGFSKFVVCTDGGLGSDKNRQFNDIDGRAFIVTQSLKKLNETDRKGAMDDRNWKRLSDHKPVDINQIKADPSKHMNELYYKEEVYGTKRVPGQLMIVTYSPKYAAYQKKIREAQLERAEKMVESSRVKKQRKNPNDPARFIKTVNTTKDGEVAEEKTYSIDQDKVDNEAMYDGFYAVCTNLVDDKVEEILAVSEGRWEIEESFRIMKTDFRARPVYVRKEDSIKAHFLVCFMALLLFRLLEQKINTEEKQYTACNIISTLRDYNVLRVNGYGYLPEYKRTDLTDRLHEVFGFRTDTEIVPTAKMRNIIANTKK
ncbi:MAG: IS1634 family transposase [Erysipelotrichaceae bacterium]|nr:IS1634 family transposase [Erysipelotrichaceae bacterium]